MTDGDWTPDQLELLAGTLAERVLAELGKCKAEHCGDCVRCQAAALLNVLGRPWQ